MRHFRPGVRKNSFSSQSGYAYCRNDKLKNVEKKSLTFNIRIYLLNSTEMYKNTVSCNI